MTDLLLDALHASPSAVVVVDADCALQTTHRVLGERAGCAAAALVGRAAWQAGVPIEPDEWPALRREAVRVGVVEFEARDGPDGGAARVRIEPTASPAGALLFLIRLDPIPSPARQAAPAWSHDPWLDRVPIPLFIHGPDGAPRDWNRAAASWLGVGPAGVGSAIEQFRASDWDLVDDDGQPVEPADAPLSQVLRTRAPVLDTVIGKGQGIRRRWFLVSAAPVFDREGVLSEVVMSITDLTVARRSEGSRARTQRLESLGRMAGGVAHDFNNLLTVVRSAAELVAIDLPPGAPSLEDLAELRRAADRGAELTRRLLGSTRGLPGDPRPQHLGRLIDGAENIVLRQVPSNVTLRMPTVDDLWPVRVDAAQFEQVLLNLVVNACDAMWPGGGTLEIAVANVAADQTDAQLRGDGDHVVLTVSDTGCGMSDDVRSRAFDPFFTTKYVGSNAGLGLSTCYSIARQHGGEVYLDSEPGRGTRVEIWLPRIARPGGHQPQGSPRGRGEARPAGTAAVLQRSSDARRDPLSSRPPMGRDAAVWGLGGRAAEGQSRKPPSMSKQRPVK